MSGYFAPIRRELAAAGFSQAMINGLEEILKTANSANTTSTGTAGDVTALQADVEALQDDVAAAQSEADIALALALSPASPVLTPAVLSWTGDATGSLTFSGSDASAALTLATVNANVGSFGTGTSVASFTVNAKGLITAASNVAITSAPKWTTARTLSFTGDVTGSGSVDGSTNVATALTLATSGVSAGSYTNADITVDAKGRITVAANGSASAGTVTHTAGALTSGQLVFGNGAADITVGNLSGDVTTSGSGATTYAAVVPANKGGAGTVSGILKANGSGTVSAAVSATDYAPATSGSSILSGNGSGGFSGVTVSTGLAFVGGVLTATGGGSGGGAGVDTFNHAFIGGL